MVEPCTREREQQAIEYCALMVHPHDACDVIKRANSLEHTKRTPGNSHTRITRRRASTTAPLIFVTFVHETGKKLSSVRVLTPEWGFAGFRRLSSCVSTHASHRSRIASGISRALATTSSYHAY
jgi:hypothetical protein